MLEHEDGFDWIPTAADDALLADYYDLVDTDITIDDSGANTHWQNGVTATSPNQRLRKSGSSTQTKITGFHFHTSTLSDRTICRFLLGGVVQGLIRITATGSIEAYRGDGVTLLQQSDPDIILANTIHWIEVKYHVDNDATIGFVVVGVDDSPAVSIRGDTQTDATAQINQIELVLDADTVMDDWVIKDTSGDTHNNFGGEAFVENAPVTSDIYYGYSEGSDATFEWFNSDGNRDNNNTFVEAPTDDDLSYITNAGVAAGERDTYRPDTALLEAILDITVPLTAVGVLYRARKESAGTETFRTHSFHPGSFSRRNGAIITVSGTSYLYYDYYWTSAANEAEWTVDRYTANEFGVSKI